DYTVLIGPNNQGKSNLLRAAVLAMEIIEGWGELREDKVGGTEVPISQILKDSRRPYYRTRTRGGERRVGYNWESDFPIFARGRRGSQQATAIRLDFELSEEEQVEFQEATGISINSKLPIKVTLKHQVAQLSVNKQGPGLHKERAGEIARFIAERVTLLYIPAVRTGETALEMVNEIISSRRRALLGSEGYAEAVRRVRQMDDQVLRELEKTIHSTLSRFIPDAGSVQLQSRHYTRSLGLEDILIDDGVPTSISAKGDGIQSLAALALTLEWTQSKNHPDRHLILAVEEPESHLHPAGVHELRSILQGIARKQQVIVTSHNPALTNRREIQHNVIVRERSAKPAKSLEELRIALGIKVSDALTSAEVVLITEGQHDAAILSPLLTAFEPRIQNWLDEGRLVVETANGGSKVYSRALAAKTFLAKPIVIIDGDGAGERDVAKLLADNVIDSTSLVKISRPSCRKSELEDIFVVDSYLTELQDHIGFTLSRRYKGKLENGRDEAWSERLSDILQASSVGDPEYHVREAEFVVS